MRPILVALVLLAGCGPGAPEGGAIYEHLLTGDRTEIDRTGECGMLYRTAEKVIDGLLAELESAPPETKRAALNAYGMAYMAPDVDSTAQCAEYQTRELINGQMMIIHDIVPIEEFSEDEWKRLN